MIEAHEADLHKMALAVPDDTVLLVHPQDHFMVTTKSRAEVLTILKDPPEVLRNPPEPVDDSTCSRWVMVFEPPDSLHWLSMSFFGEPGSKKSPLEFVPLA